MFSLGRVGQKEKLKTHPSTSCTSSRFVVVWLSAILGVQVEFTRPGAWIKLNMKGGFEKWKLENALKSKGAQEGGVERDFGIAGFERCFGVYEIELNRGLRLRSKMCSE